MSKFKTWLYNRFLPAWCKDDLLAANKRLETVATEQRQEIERLNAYIGGLETGIRAQRRMTINVGEVNK